MCDCWALNDSGNVAGAVTHAVPHGVTLTVSTRFTVAYNENDSLATGFLNQGGINIESTQSGVFCSAMTIDAVAAIPVGLTLPLVRVNAHPGTAE
jgi:hypothetical protein